MASLTPAEDGVLVLSVTEDFPAEAKVDGFDNNGEALVTSGMLLDHYFLAAEEAIKRATHFSVSECVACMLPICSDGP